MNMGATPGTLRLGTSSWSSRDWAGVFYEPGTPPADYIRAYAERFDTVEIDATFYAVPRRSTVEGWRDRTPETFLFSAKAPGEITHKRFLEGCEDLLHRFIDTMSLLGPRLGPVLFQFPYYTKKSGVTRDDFLKRLAAFLPTLPRGGKWAVEVRNKTWIGKPLLDLLSEHQVPIALIDHPWMHGPDTLFATPGILTGPFVYIRWLGDRHGIERMTTTWNETVVDRRPDILRWIPHIQALLERPVPVLGYVNNHYAGYAPATVELIQQLMRHA
jgi:uncharacterized protein YecE (DUF72 family)